MEGLVVTLVSWIIAVLGIVLYKHGFKNPSTSIIPSHIRHTWFAGLSVLIIIFLFCLPMLLFGNPLAGMFIFVMLLISLGRKGLTLLIQDVRLHRIEGRSLFQHSEDCYMVKGRTATFVKKRREKLLKKPNVHNL